MVETIPFTIPCRGLGATVPELGLERFGVVAHPKTCFTMVLPQLMEELKEKQPDTKWDSTITRFNITITRFTITIPKTKTTNITITNKLVMIITENSSSLL